MPSTKGKPAGLLPVHPPADPKDTPFVHSTYMAPTASPALFDGAAPPNYSEAPGASDQPPPSFTEVPLTFSTSGLIIHPVSPHMEESVPLYTLSSTVIEKNNKIVILSRLYHRVSLTCELVKETALPVYEIHKSFTVNSLKPLLEAASYRHNIKRERKLGIRGVTWDFECEVAARGVFTPKHLFTVRKKKGNNKEERWEWEDNKGEVVAWEFEARKKGKEYRNELGRDGLGDRNMPVLKVLRQMDKANLDLLVAAWCLRL